MRYNDFAFLFSTIVYCPVVTGILYSHKYCSTPASFSVWGDDWRKVVLILDLEVKILLIKIHFSTSLGGKKVSHSTSQNGRKSAFLCTKCGSLMWVSLFLCYLQLLKPNKYWLLFENSSLLCCTYLCVCTPWMIVYCFSVLYFIVCSLALIFALRSAEIFRNLWNSGKVLIKNSSSQAPLVYLYCVLKYH